MRQPGADRAEAEADAEQDQRDSGNARRGRRRRRRGAAGSRQRDRLAEDEEEDREQRAGDAAEQALEHERAAHEPVRRADELHHLDLASSREDREPDRVRDQQRSTRRRARRVAIVKTTSITCATCEDAVRDLLAVVHPVDDRRLARQDDRVVERSTFSALSGVTLERVGQRVDGRSCDEVRVRFFICASASAFEMKVIPPLDVAGSAAAGARSRSPARVAVTVRSS